MTSAYLSPVVPQIGDILSIIRAKLEMQTMIELLELKFSPR